MDKIIDRFLKFLMVVIIIWLATHILTSRYEVYGAGQGVGYRLDTWTGQVSFLEFEEEFKMKYKR